MNCQNANANAGVDFCLHSLKFVSSHHVEISVVLVSTIFISLIRYVSPINQSCHHLCDISYILSHLQEIDGHGDVTHWFFFLCHFCIAYFNKLDICNEGSSF